MMGWALLASMTHAAPKIDSSKKVPWRLTEYLALAHQSPKKLLGEAERLMSKDQIRVSRVEAGAAFEWQDRLAMVSALSDFFDPLQSRRVNAQIKAQARSLISRAMLEDPSLVVRDGAVEAIRRVFRMQPGEARLWRKGLERAFLNPANIIDGEGLFIRETILTAMREGNLLPSQVIQKAARRDKNEGVRSLLARWDTRNFGEMPKSKVSTFR